MLRVTARFNYKICGKSCEDAWALRRHSGIHEGEGRIDPCPQCPMKSTSRRSFTEHMRTEHKLMEWSIDRKKSWVKHKFTAEMC